MLASVSGQITSLIGNHGVYAVFLLMAIDAVFPAASEVVMLYAGALASGAFAGEQVVLFGKVIPSGFWAFVVMVLAGTIGYTARRDRRLGDRRLRRPSLPRAPRPLAPPVAAAAREGGALVRPLGRQGRLPRPDRADRPLVHLDPGRRLPHAAAPLHVAHARGLDDLVPRLRGRRLRARRQLQQVRHRSFATSTTSSSCWWRRSSWSGSSGAYGGALPAADRARAG